MEDLATLLIIQALNGICFSTLLFLLAAGLSVAQGLMGIINLAHGSFYMIGGYIGLSVYRWTGNIAIGVMVAAIGVLLVGIGVERALLRHFYRQHLEQVLVTFGLVYIFMDLAKSIWGKDPHAIPAPTFLSSSIKIMGAPFPLYRLSLIVIGILVATSLWLLQDKTRYGAVLRAGVDNKEMASGLGINIPLIFTAVFGLSAFMAGFGGVLGGPIIGVYPGQDLQILVYALIVVVIGGLGSLQGAMVGSLLVGMVDSFGKAFFPGIAMFIMYGVMAIVLALRPSGLLGRE
jgi:branched-chain amino acid transport system permease protein